MYGSFMYAVRKTAEDLGKISMKPLWGRLLGCFRLGKELELLGVR